MFPPEMKYLPFGLEVIKKELADLGPWSKQEKVLLVVFLAAVALWIAGDYIRLPLAVVLISA
jgi:sodium-dependent dicarboxylate transporter 2/3/5